MSDFYELLAKHYDSIFPAEPQIVDFLADRLGSGPWGPRSPGSDGLLVIDAACGTGNYTDALVRCGFDCRGFDASEAMIANARRGNRRGEFEVRNLQDLRGVGGPANGLFCIGNSLPHLPSFDAVWDVLSDAGRVLVPGSPVIVQTVNFARFTGDEEIELPPVERPDVTMTRSYRPGGESDTVIFHAELATAAGERAAGDTPLLVLSREALIDAARDAGFSDMTMYGAYDGSAYDRSDSFLMILTAIRSDADSHFG